MVPVYSLCSLFSFGFIHTSLYIQLIRDGYEGFVVYNFMNLFLEYLGPDEATRLQRLSQKSRYTAPPPWCCFTYDPKARSFLQFCKLGVIQYCVIRIGTSVTSVLLEYFGLLCHGSMSPTHGNFYMTILNSVSMGLAMFTLIAYYLPTRIDISHHAPVSQFMSIKFVIFFQFWLGLLMNILVQEGWLRPSKSISIPQMSVLLPNLLTCMEMTIASFWHLWAFDYAKYQSSATLDIKDALWDSFYWLDLVYDMQLAFQFLSNRSHSYHQLSPLSEDDEEQGFLENGDSSIADDDSPLINK
jgi:hypothetical protein